MFEEQLAWTKGYYARPVDDHNIHIVKKYISNQSKHKMPFGELKEYLDWIEEQELGQQVK